MKARRGEKDEVGHENDKSHDMDLNMIYGLKQSFLATQPPITQAISIVMAPREALLKSLAGETTAYLCYSFLIALLGPLQFGFHIVYMNSHPFCTHS